MCCSSHEQQEFYLHQAAAEKGKQEEWEPRSSQTRGSPAAVFVLCMLLQGPGEGDGRAGWSLGSRATCWLIGDPGVGL